MMTTEKETPGVSPAASEVFSAQPNYTPDMRRVRELLEPWDDLARRHKPRWTWKDCSVHDAERIAPQLRDAGLPPERCRDELANHVWPSGQPREGLAELVARVYAQSAVQPAAQDDSAEPAAPAAATVVTTDAAQSVPATTAPAAKPETIPFSGSQKVTLELWELARSALESELEEEDRLLQISKTHRPLGIKVIRKEYAVVKAAYLKEKEESNAPKPTAEELAQQERQAKDREEDQQRIAAIVKSLQASPNLHAEFHKQLQRSGYICDERTAAIIFVTHGARLLAETTFFAFYGASGSGKTDAWQKGASFLPPEVEKPITCFSDQALFYMGSLKHRYLRLGEITPKIDEEDDYVQKAMRQLISDNKVTRVVVEKSDGNTNVAVEKATEGPCVIVATTTREPMKFNNEYVNRGTWIASDDAKHVTRAVMRSMAARAKEPLLPDDIDHALFKKAFQEFHRTLQPLTVTVPFADKIIPSGKYVTDRRLYKLLLNYVAANALLHQHQRKREKVGDREQIVAQSADYEVAYMVAMAAAPRVQESCPPRAREFFDKTVRPKFEELYKEAPAVSSIAPASLTMTTNQITRLTDIPEETIRRWLRDYAKCGLLIQLERGAGDKQNTYGPPLDDKGNLTFPEHIVQDLELVKPEDIGGVTIEPKPVPEPPPMPMPPSQLAVVEWAKV